MKIPIWYCDGETELCLPESWRVDLYDLPQKRLTPLPSDHWFNRRVIPADLAEFTKGAQRLLIVVNDHYRPTPTAKVLDAIAGALPLDRTAFLVATALHGAPSEAQLRQDIRRQL